jgi:hypothetical protein
MRCGQVGEGQVATLSDTPRYDLKITAVGGSRLQVSLGVAVGGKKVVVNGKDECGGSGAAMRSKGDGDSCRQTDKQY